MDANGIKNQRKEQVWLDAKSGDFDTFEKLVSRKTNAEHWPFADAIEQNVPVYDGDKVRALANSPEDKAKLMAEWCEVFTSGPGLVAIKGAMQDKSVIDASTALFEAMIEEQHKTGDGGGDHFAKPGANDRIWNAAEKHCLADTENFIAYYSNIMFDLVSRAWLGEGYQLTAQINRVNPGGTAQTAHRDYHLGFMKPEQIESYPTHVHKLSPMLTLQGAVAHVDMPLESGPTLYLPYSQLFLEGYLAFGREEYQNYFIENRAQLPLEKGDAVFFNPALMHGAGTNVSSDIYRMANLFQVSSIMGRAIETVDRAKMVKALYPHLHSNSSTNGLSAHDLECVINCSAEAYPFPTNLDTDPPVGGLAPKGQAAILRAALEKNLTPSQFNEQIDKQVQRRLS